MTNQVLNLFDGDRTNKETVPELLLDGDDFSETASEEENQPVKTSRPVDSESSESASSNGSANDRNKPGEAQSSSRISDTELQHREEIRQAINQKIKENGNPPLIDLKQKDDGSVVWNGTRDECKDGVGLMILQVCDILDTTSKDEALDVIYKLIDMTQYLESIDRREMAINRMLTQLKEMDIDSPRERIVAVEMVVANQIQKRLSTNAINAGTTEKMDMYMKWAERFMKMTDQKMQTIDDLTEEPEQTIRVERVNVSDGGQAMVGNFQKDDQGAGG